MLPAIEHYFRDGWAQPDERYRRISTLMRNRVATDFDCTTPEEKAHVTTIIRRFFALTACAGSLASRSATRKDVRGPTCSAAS
jgi:hypothetical protein